MTPKKAMTLMTTTAKSARTAYVVPVFTCLASVFKLQVLTYDDNTNLFTCTGETYTLDVVLFKAICNMIDPDMSVEIQGKKETLYISNK